MDRYVEKLNPDYVVTDNFTGTLDVVNAIAEMGIESIHFISGAEQVTSVRDRMLGYTTAVNSLGLPCSVVFTHIDLIIKHSLEDAPIDRESSEYICLKKTIQSIKLPAALFSVNPIINMVVQEVLEDLNIPNDQIILGHFDSDPPTKTTDRCYFEVSQPFTEMGAKAVQIVMDKISGNMERQQIALKPKLTIHNLSSFPGARAEVTTLVAVART